MLPIEKTFRVLRRSVWNGALFVNVIEKEVEAFDRLSASPFDNPWHLLQPVQAPVEAASPADIDLIRAAYFATFPAVD